MNSILIKLITGKKILQKDIEEGLYEVCDNVHSTCDFTCPIYEFVLTQKQRENSGCPYFKDGTKMLEALRLIKNRLVKI